MVTNFISSPNSTFSVFTWQPPVKSNGGITEYQLQCSGGGLHCDGDHNHTEWTPTIHQLLLQHHSSHQCWRRTCSNYQCDYTTRWWAKTACYSQSCITLLSCIVPSGPPYGLLLSTASHALTLSWSPPLPSQRNGVIISYLITCSSGGSIINSTRTSSTSLTITGLQPFTNYTCSVRAATTVGDGPATMLNIVTSEEGKIDDCCNE